MEDAEVKRHHPAFIKDPVHDMIVIDGEIKHSIINSEAFSRLSGLKQLGNACHVYPGASHTRSEHSIGAWYLSRRIINRLLWNSSGSAVVIPEHRVQKAIEIAALCHDLGHGPLSHFFEDRFIGKKIPGWNHEAMSCSMYDHIVDSNHLDFNEDFSKMVKSMIVSDGSISDSIPGCLRSVISDKQCGIHEADRLDYIPRDCMYSKVNISVDIDRIIIGMRASPDLQNVQQIIKNYDLVNQLLSERVQLFSRVYHHPRTIAIDLMTRDILFMADEQFKITETARDPNLFVNLDDSIISEIRRNSKDPEVKNLIRRIDKGEFYTLCGSIVLSGDDKAHFDSERNAREIESYGGLKANSIICEFTSKNYGLPNGRNPMDHVIFYGDNMETPSTMKGHHGILVPRLDCLVEHTLWIFSNDPKVNQRIANFAVHKWARQKTNMDLFVQ